MRTVKLLLILFLIGNIIIQYSCKRNELGEIGFPRVRTLVVEMITDTGAVFKGEIMDIPADCEIIDHGFVWSDSKNALVAFEKISLGQTNKTGVFRAVANKAMIEGKTYYFKSFVKTSTTTVFGNELEFVSMGSNAPVITSVSPAFGSWNDTISIRGKYFSNNPYQISVYFNDFQTNVISCNDSVIKTTVPVTLDTVKSKVSIKCYNALYPGTKEFELRPTVSISSIEPATGIWNTVVKIRGKNFNVIQKVLFGESLATTKYRTETLIEAVVPFSLNSENCDINLVNNKFQFKSSTKFGLIKGKIQAIIPNKGTSGTEVTIKANNVRISSAKVSINGIDAPVKSKTDSSLTVIMPVLSKSGNYSIVITDGSFSITYENSFDYKIPEITNLSDAAWGDTLVISGHNFDVVKNLKIYFGEDNYKYEELQIISISESSVKALISLDHRYYLKQLFLEGDNYKYPEILDYVIPDPVIYEVNGPTDYKHPLVTIKGKYFHPSDTEISLVETGTVFSGASQVTSTSIKCNMPNALRGNYSIKILIPQAQNYGGKPTIFNNCIQWDVPLKLYQSFNDINFTAYWSIFPFKNGQNFYIKTWYGSQISEYYYEHNSTSPNQIANSLPEIHSSATFTDVTKIFICTGYLINPNTTYLKSFFEFDPVSNTYKSLPDFPGQGRANTKGFSLNGKGYLIGGYSHNYDNYSYSIYNEIWQYDFSSQNWTLVNNNLSLDRSVNIETFQVGSYIYIFNKFNIWKFDPADNSLENVSNIPAANEQYLTPQPFFYKADKIYFQLGRFQNECWAFDLVQKKWSFVFYFPDIYQYIRHSYLIDNKAYLVINTFNANPDHLTILEFDPSYLK